MVQIPVFIRTPTPRTATPKPRRRLGHPSHGTISSPPFFYAADRCVSRVTLLIIGEKPAVDDTCTKSHSLRKKVGNYAFRDNCLDASICALFSLAAFSQSPVASPLSVDDFVRDFFFELNSWLKNLPRDYASRGECLKNPGNDLLSPFDYHRPWQA